MNYYERIQNSINFIEAHLTDEFTVEQSAKEACMSMATYYRIFFAIAGFTVKEYIRKRRLNSAAEELISISDEKDETVTQIAFNYGYTNSDSFSRAFKEEFGMNPSLFKSLYRQNKKLKYTSTNCKSIPQSQQLFRRINIMDKYFEMNNFQLIKDYPDIKVLKNLQPMKVACYKYFGDNPEDNAFSVMKDWVQKNGIRLNARTDTGESAYRIFGFNNPDPSNPEDQSETYGYEVCVTIDDQLFETLEDAPFYGAKEKYPYVMRKILTGGRYAVVTVKREKEKDIGYGIMKAWQRFIKWMEVSKFIWGSNQQYLEEHLGFSDDDSHTGDVELYMPIQEPNTNVLKSENLIKESISKYNVAYCRIDCTDFEKGAFEAWKEIFDWAQKNKLSAKDCRVFMFGSGFRKEPPFFHEIMITLPNDFTFTDNKDSKVKTKTFTGGNYITLITDNAHQMEMWGALAQLMKETKTKGANHQWVAEWTLNNWSFPEKQLKLCYPVGE